MFGLIKKFTLVLVTAILLGGCSTQIKTIQDKSIDFSNYHTFCWMNGCDFAMTTPDHVVDPAFRENIKKAIIQEFRNRGITEDSNNPDLLIGFNITIKDEKAIIYHREGDAPFYVPMEANEEVINYQKGTLVIGIADKKQSKLIWESQASRYMDVKPDFSEKNVAKGIHRIMKKFPVSNR